MNPLDTLFWSAVFFFVFGCLISTRAVAGNWTTLGVSGIMSGTILFFIYLVLTIFSVLAT